MVLSELRNAMQVTQDIASSGQPGRGQFHDIAASGYRAVINLAMPTSDNAIADEDRVVDSLGMQYIHIPVPFEAPTAAHLGQFIAAMQALRGQKVWVHCALNYRASAFLYQYFRLALGWPAAEAQKALLPGWQPDEVWLDFMRLSLDAYDLPQ